MDNYNIIWIYVYVIFKKTYVYIYNISIATEIR